MPSEIGVSEERELRRYFERVNALSCIRFLIWFEISFKAIKVISICSVLYITRHQAPEQNLKLFLAVYACLSAAKGIAFYLKNRSFFSIRRIPDFEENNDITLINNVLEATMLFWYILGFHWIQECKNCEITYPLLYYTTVIWVTLGFFAFVAPLLAIVLLLTLIHYIRPKLKVIVYSEDDKLPNDNNKCTICYDDYRNGSRVKILPCDHHFHAECIDEWFHVKDSCPLCKKNINLLYDLVEADDTDI